MVAGKCLLHTGESTGLWQVWQMNGHGMTLPSRVSVRGHVVSQSYAQRVLGCMDELSLDLDVARPKQCLLNCSPVGSLDLNT